MSSQSPIFDLSSFTNELRSVSPFSIAGEVLDVRGSSITARLSGVAIGDLVEIVSDSQTTTPCNILDVNQKNLAFVVAVSKTKAILSPLKSSEGILPGDKIVSSANPLRIHVSAHLLGTVIDSFGSPLQRGATTDIQELTESFAQLNKPTSDRSFSICTPKRISIRNNPPKALDRQSISQPFVTGIRAIDGFIPIGYGQRLSIFAEPGVGKSTLMATIAKNSSADVNVIGLIGERGREVGELLYDTFDQETLKRTIVVVSTSDETAVSRVSAAMTATSIAEYFRDYGYNVLLQIDSLTRLFRAYREIGLAAGEFPVRRGYPSSVFAELPRLIERCGVGSVGSITALYTVLLSSNVDEDPMVEEVKGLTDGHIMLTRELAEQSHYPAIDVLRSVSRLTGKLHNPELRKAVSNLRQVLARTSRDRDLAMLSSNTDPKLERLFEFAAKINSFLQQRSNESTSNDETKQQILKLYSESRCI